MTIDAWPRVAVMGAGAVGCYFGGMLARAGAPVTFIGRAAHVEAITANGLLLQTRDFQEMVQASASTDAAAVGGAQMVLFAVKTTDTEAAANALLPHLLNGAVLVCLQNGVDGAERIRGTTRIDAIPATVYVAAEMAAPGVVKHAGRGDLVIGDPSQRGESSNQRRHDIDRIAEIFGRAGVPCRVSASIERDLWTKMVMNCAYNAISALSRTRYARLVADPGTREVMRHAIEETVAVARGLGVAMPDGMVEAGWKLADSMPNALSSTGQDILRGKRTEIDSLNGHVARRGAELGIPTPVNQTLHALVKLLEEQMFQ
ncbi:MAG: ketopantoate reductase family protein [Vicinamibacteraceae bacterium]